MPVPEVVVGAKIGVYIALLGCVALCSAVETALLRQGASRSRVPSWSAASLGVWEDRPDAVLGVLLALANLANVGIGVVTVSLQWNIWITIALVLVFGEILPKVGALNHVPVVIRIGMPPIILLERWVRPVVDALAAAGVRVAGMLMGGRRAESPFLTREELQEIVAGSSGVPHEEQMLYRRIMDLADKRIYEVMTPRERIVAVGAGESLDEMIQRLSRIKYSRVPVYRGSLDTIVGVLYTKDITVALQSRELIVLDDLIRPPVFTINTAQVVDVLKQFRQGRQHLAIVVDEYGATVGLVTIEDILEELFGEIYDEYDVREQRSRAVDANTYVIAGSESLRNVNDLLKADFQEEEVVTFSGYLVTRLGRVPSVGERIRCGCWEVEVLDASPTLVRRARVRRLPEGRTKACT